MLLFLCTPVLFHSQSDLIFKGIQHEKIRHASDHHDVGNGCVRRRTPDQDGQQQV